jgi:hypothetical protein
MSGESMIGPDQRYLWLCVPKNASRSIAAMLSDVGASRIMDMYSGPLRPEWVESNLRPSFTFAFVRNPYDRILSVWRNKIAPPQPNENTRALYGRHRGLHANMTFDAFIVWLVESYPKGEVNKHWAAQSDFLSDGIRLLPDFIGRIEDLEGGLREVAVVTGHLGQIRQKNVSSKSDGLSAAVISPRTRKAIHTIYREDFELFGYDDKLT